MTWIFPHWTWKTSVYSWISPIFGHQVPLKCYSLSYIKLSFYISIETTKFRLIFKRFIIDFIIKYWHFQTKALMEFLCQSLVCQVYIDCSLSPAYLSHGHYELPQIYPIPLKEVTCLPSWPEVLLPQFTPFPRL